MTRHRVGVIGAGDWAESHIRAWQTIPEVTVTHLVGHSDIGRTDSLARLYGVPRAALNLLDIARPGEIDALDVVTSPAFRLEALEVAAKLQIPRVNLEKPISLTGTDLNELQAFVAGHDIAVAVNHQKRFLPGVAWALRQITEGRIGEVRVVAGTCRGSLNNQAGHVLDLIGQIIDLHRVDFRKAEIMPRVREPVDSDDGAGGLLGYAGGGVDVALSIGEAGRWISPGPYWMQVGVDVLGTKGAVSFGINRSSVLLAGQSWEESEPAPSVDSRDTCWERDKVAAEKAHLEFFLTASRPELDKAFRRAVRVTELLLRSQAQEG
jgi:predicted dehydrogenase